MSPSPLLAVQAALIAECAQPDPFLNRALYRLLGQWVALGDDTRNGAPDTASVRSALLAAGFQSDDCLRLDKSVYDQQPIIMGRYCVGQVISMSLNMGAIHPLMGEWLIALSERPDFEALREQRELLASLPEAPAPSKRGL